jgi:osmoprotectant transport system permease protein
MASTAAIARAAAPDRPAQRIDRLGALVTAISTLAVVLAPLLVFKANRIASGEPRFLLDALPLPAAVAFLVLLVAIAAAAVLPTRPLVRLAAAIVGLVALALAAGHGADWLTPADDRYARVALGGAFWLLLFALALVATDAIARLRPGPLARVAALAIVAGAVGWLLASGTWDDVSVMREYAVRRASFWREAERHVLLSLGSLAGAVAIGLPLGILCHRRPLLRTPILQGLSLVQTIPSIALFGILMVPLGWLAARVPLAAELGIRGIGAAPALVALFLYALLPVVANTVVGLAQVPPAVVDAARGMGLTSRQLLAKIELPLALPVILTGIRIVLVQSIGLVTVAALIGGGGFGTFVFQGIGQTAMDLVLLGAAPTVALAFAAAVLLDAAVDLSRKGAA